jgi:undecaprenyl-diphosphatase
VILPRLVGWNIHQNDNAFLVFLVATHLATALVLIGFYRKTWLRIARGVVRSLAQREIRANDSEAKLGWLLIVGTVPAGLIGVLFQDQIRTTFVTAQSAAFFLALNGLVLLGAEYLRRRATNSASDEPVTRLSRLTWPKTIGIGSVQALALIPGLSRSGSAMGGGLLAGLSHEDAAEFAFLLATPIILAAAVLKLPDLFLPENAALIGPCIVGAIFTAVTAYFTVKFLTRYFKTNSLIPFGIYCLAAGIGSSLLFLR